jgi:hypothetical protein
MILALSGKSGSGKDIVGKIIQYLTDKDKGGYSHPDSQNDFESYCKNFKQKYCDWEIKKYAGKVKEIASLLTGIPIEKFEDQEFKKTTLSEEWDFADNDAPDNIMTIRMFLQKLGTEAMRNGLHTNVWVNALFADYKQTWNDPDPIPDNDYTITWRENYTDETTLIHYGKGSEAEVFEYEINNPNWIITDLRFPNEYEAIKSREGITIRVVRPGINLLDHPSETSLDNAEFDYTIVNDSTIEDLVIKVKEILVKEKII